MGVLATAGTANEDRIVAAVHRITTRVNGLDRVTGYTSGGFAKTKRRDLSDCAAAVSTANRDRRSRMPDVKARGKMLAG